MKKGRLKYVGTVDIPANISPRTFPKGQMSRCKQKATIMFCLTTTTKGKVSNRVVILCKDGDEKYWFF